MMNAVKAAQQIDHSASAAYDSKLSVDHSPEDVMLANTAVHMDGVLTPKLIDEMDLDHVDDSDIQVLKEEVRHGLLTKENLPYLDEDQLAKLQEASQQHSLTENQMKTLLYVDSRIRQVQNETNTDLVDTINDDYPGPAACSVAAACVAVVAVAVYNTAGAAVNVVAAVAVETYVGVT
ncbi:hypothetical protein [Halocatena salina]|uniref:Uncharacterized protein n=1 Tax=Halocatena salina TaxID=2934340 RepID=A0A8U0A7D5_9EURY|nr:hypothetical protein [Halocatena salina]UPM44759.1 hypothetical protein MW046_15265 [Halocatena salina]